MLNDQLLEAFINGFYGFGNYQAPYWFVGMEEAGGKTPEEIDRQLQIWDKWGRGELLDVVAYAREMGINSWYGDNAVLQRTWRNLIRVYLTAEGKTANNDTMREYQRTEWGTKDGDICLTELMPLPSPNATAWLYREISQLPYLASRETYLEHVADSRIAHFRERITQFQPKVVVFYGSMYDKYWRRIVGITSWDNSVEGLSYTKKHTTLFISSKHPQNRGVTNEYFQQIGELIIKEQSKQL